MSIKLMTLAWDMKISCGTKLVLLSLCDSANDHGECFPSVPTIAKKCSMSERSIFSHIDWLEKRAVLYRENRKGRSSVYHIDPSKLFTPEDIAGGENIADTPEDSAPTPANSAGTHAKSAPITVTEPSIEPSRESLNASRTKQLPEIRLLDGIKKQVAIDFLAIRKAKKSPLTETAIAGIQREAGRLGYTLEQALTICCERGWAGFKAEWVTQDQATGKIPISKDKEKQEATERAYARVFGTDEKEIQGEATRL